MKRNVAAFPSQSFHVPVAVLQSASRPYERSRRSAHSVQGRRFVMKIKVTGTRVLTAIAAVVFLMAAAAPARAEQRMIANVPFDFIVGHLRLPAGHYIVTEADDPALVSIANTDGHAFTFVLTIAGSNDQTASEPELVFK